MSEYLEHPPARGQAIAEWANFAALVYLGTLIVLVFGGSFYAWVECANTLGGG